jgi:hypothetical protein
MTLTSIDWMTEFRTRLMSLLQAKHHNIRVLAKIIGVDYNTLTCMVNGSIPLTVEITLRISDYLMVPMDFLLGRTECKTVYGIGYPNDIDLRYYPKQTTTSLTGKQAKYTDPEAEENRHAKQNFIRESKSIRGAC